MSEQIQRRSLRKLCIQIASISTLLLVPAIALALFGAPALPLGEKLDARSFAPMPSDKKTPIAATSVDDNVEVNLKVWEYTDNRRSKK